MVGPCRRFLALLVWGGSFGFVLDRVQAQEPTTEKPATTAEPTSGRLAPGAYALPGEDPPKSFVPAHPRTVAESKRIESLRYYATARAQEDLREYPEAIQSLEKALAADPDATAVLRRLSRICFAMGKDVEAIAYCQRVIAADPGDIETVALLIDHYKDDPQGAEALLKTALANPKLDKASTGALFLEFELGNIYESTLRFDQAADSFLQIVDALDEKSNARLSPSELRRFLGNDEAQAYLHFGRVFLQARRFDQAIRSFRRGLVYDGDEPLLLLYLSQAFQEAERNDEALATIERFLQRQPRGRETYDLLIKILVKLNRGAEVIPRLENYAAIDPRNVPLQYALAEQYKEAGQADKAKAIYNKLLDDQKETQGFGENFPRLVKERKTEELITLLVRVTGRMKRLDPIRTQVDELANDGAYIDEVLDTGLKMISATPPPFDPQDGWFVLVNLASQANRPEKKVALLRWSLNRMPNPLIYRELLGTLVDLGRYGEAEQTLRELFEKFRTERTTRNLITLAQIQARGNQFAEALTTIEGALAQDPNDPDAIRIHAVLLNQSGKSDEAIGVLKDLIAKNQNNDEVLKFARSTLSTVYTNLGDYAKGEAELEVLFARDPSDATVNNDLGYLYADQGKNLEQAETMIRKALSVEPSNAAFLDSLGWVLFKRGKIEEAKTPLEKAAADPKNEDTTVHDHLGDVYFQLQERARAKSSWERAVQLGTQSRPPDKRLPEIRKKLQLLGEFDPSPRPAKASTP